MSLVYKEEGLKALFKGLSPKLVRFGPGGAIMMIAYEEVYKYLKQNYKGWPNSTDFIIL